MTTYLLSCVSMKRKTPHPAKDLYISPLFLKMRAYVEKTGEPWYILSAKYGLVHPETLIEDYDLTLNTMSKKDRLSWSAKVLKQMHLSIDIGSLTFFAGDRYREFLIPTLEDLGYKIEVPMKGMTIGKQLKWLIPEKKKLKGFDIKL